MKTGIHPEYRFVVFRDVTNNAEILTKSTVDLSGKPTTNIDGVDYPVILVDISASSHPFYTGQQKIMDIEGRVDKYYRKYGFQNPGQG